MSTDKITIRRIDVNDWQVWLPHSCAPWESDDPDVPQVGWGTFYFNTWSAARDFVLWALRWWGVGSERRFL